MHVYKILLKMPTIKTKPWVLMKTWTVYKLNLYMSVKH